MAATDDLYAQAVRCHASGQLAQAEPLYRQILQVDPNHADALHLLGVLAHQSGHSQAGIALIRQAIALRPEPIFQVNLGIVYKDQGFLADAMQCYRQALRLDANCLEAHNNLAIALAGQGELAEAGACYRQALGIDPNNADMHNNLANVLKDQGQLEEAIASYQTALRLRPNHPEVYNNLGNALVDVGRLDEACACYREALALNPAHADVHNNLGHALASQGQANEAIVCFQEVLRLNPNHAEAHNNLANALAAQGRLAEAIAGYREAVRSKPSYAIAHYNLGNALKAQGQSGDAVESYRQALRLNPTYADAHNNLGVALKALGHSAEAIVCYQQALAADPNHGDAHNNLGNALKDEGNVSSALASYQLALAINPNHADALSNLGIMLMNQEKTAEAIACFQKALRVKPDHVEAHNNLGNALIAAGEFEAGARCFEQALRLNPVHAGAHGNLGVSRKNEGKLAEAAACFEQALAIDPKDTQALWNRSLLRLLTGDFLGGWPDYEARWAQPGKVARRFAQPRWDGSPLAGKTILVYAEQGLGDTLQFLRYLPMVRARGGRVVFECPPPLAGLLSSCHGVDELVLAGSALPAFDLQIPHLSLPGVFETTLATIPGGVPYITANASLVDRHRQHLAGLSLLTSGQSGITAAAPLRVGIVWQGNPRFPGDRSRSIPLHHFLPLARLPGVKVFSLQKERTGVEQLHALGDHVPIVDLSDRLESFEDTAAIMLSLDLIISSCTSVPHLAGALGVPVWTVLQFIPDWRWQLAGETTPWYPSMRLFRQRRAGDWDEVFLRVAAELRRASQTRSVS